MFGIGQSEVLIIMLAVLILFGARRIPEVARSLGKGMSDIRSTMTSLEREIRSAPPPAGRPTPEAVEPDGDGTVDAEDSSAADAPVPEEPGPGRDLSG